MNMNCQPEREDIPMAKNFYYAHPMSWYGTLGEKEDMKAIARTGARPVNPNSFTHQKAVKDIYDRVGTSGDAMQYFIDYVRVYADAVVFRRFYDRTISASVAQEVMTAILWGKPVYELVDNVDDNGDAYVTLEEIKPYLGPIASITDTKDKIRRGEM